MTEKQSAAWTDKAEASFDIAHLKERLARLREVAAETPGNETFYDPRTPLREDG